MEINRGIRASKVCRCDRLFCPKSRAFCCHNTTRYPSTFSPLPACPTPWGAVENNCTSPTFVTSKPFLIRSILMREVTAFATEGRKNTTERSRKTVGKASGGSNLRAVNVSMNTGALKTRKTERNLSRRGRSYMYIGILRMNICISYTHVLICILFDVGMWWVVSL